MNVGCVGPSVVTQGSFALPSCYKSAVTIIHDTVYRRRVMKVLQDAYNHEGGTLTIKDGPAKGTFPLIFS